jgi:hypothetical protein
MKEQPKQEEHYGARVWVNPTIESLRRKECLCLNCGKIGGCAKAKALYQICKDGDLALAVTRCPDWEEKV